MPTYEYQCDACNHNFDEFQSMKDEPLTKCPKCKKKKLRRLIGAGTGFIFRGSGFYITDYRSEAYKADAKADAEASKPAAKAEGEAAKPAEAGSKDAGKKETKSTASEPAKSKSPSKSKK
jgi:putative FmdB family regulatory protein